MVFCGQLQTCTGQLKNLCCWCIPPPQVGDEQYDCLLVDALILCPLCGIYLFIYHLFLLQWSFFFFTIFCLHLCTFCWWFCCLKWASRTNAEVPPSVPKHRKPWCALWRRYGCRYTSFTQSYGAVGHEINVSESPICIKQDVFKQKHT